jgi:hypothetical protein
MKILFTGMSSSHCKEPNNVSFFSTLASAYSELGTVTWSEPKIFWTRSNLEEFDLVIFGFSPLTSPAANKLYGALHVLNLMYESPKLRLVVDSPQIWQYKNSTRSFKRDPDQIFSSFFANRVDYLTAKTGPVRSAIESVADKMATLEWPKTLVPSVPWLSSSAIADKISFIDSGSVVPVSVDSLLLTTPVKTIIRTETWAVENMSSSWWKTVAATARYPGLATKPGTKATDTRALEVIKTSLGLIMPPQDRKIGTWWSYRHIQALNTETPVVTYWQDTVGFDQSWGLLAYQVEDSDTFARQQIASEQLISYRNNIPGRDEVLNKLESIVLDLSKERI